MLPIGGASSVKGVRSMGLPRLVSLSMRCYKGIFNLDYLGNCNCKIFCLAEKDFKNSKLQGDSAKYQNCHLRELIEELKRTEKNLKELELSK